MNLKFFPRAENRFYFPVLRTVMMSVISFENAWGADIIWGGCFNLFINGAQLCQVAGQSTLDRSNEPATPHDAVDDIPEIKAKRGRRDASAFLEFLQNLGEILCSTERKQKIQQIFIQTGREVDCCLKSADQQLLLLLLLQWPFLFIALDSLANGIAFKGFTFAR